MWPTFLNKIWDTRPSRQDMLRKVRFFYLTTHLPSRSSQSYNQPVINSKSLQSMPRMGEYNVQLTQILYLATAPATNLITFVSIPFQSLSLKSALKNTWTLSCRNLSQSFQRVPWRKRMLISREQGKREAEIKINVAPQSNRAQQLKFLKGALMAFIQSCITMIIPSSFAFFLQRQSNAKPAKWTSVTGIYRHLPQFARLLAWFMLTCTVCLTCFTFCMN